MPEPDALREASYFVERLAEERMPLAGLILNRVHSAGIIPLSAARSLAAAETLEAMQNGDAATASSTSYPVTAAALRLHAERMNLGERERRVAGSFMSTHPAVPVLEVPALPEDIHDLAGLRRVGEAFATD
jgi:anion-transporting  ArsA/GET3 family ATPase